MTNSSTRQVPTYEGGIPYDLPQGIELPGEDGHHSSLAPYYDWLKVEAGAERIISFTCTLPVIGPVTTPDYASRYMYENHPEFTPRQRDGSIDLKMARQHYLRDTEQIHFLGGRIMSWAADSEPRLARSFMNRINDGSMRLESDDYTRYFGSLIGRNIMYAEGPDETPLAIHAEKTGGVAPVVLKPGDIGFEHTVYAMRSLFDDDLIPIQNSSWPEAGSVFFKRAELLAFITGVKKDEFDYLTEEK